MLAPTLVVLTTLLPAALSLPAVGGPHSFARKTKSQTASTSGGVPGGASASFKVGSRDAQQQAQLATTQGVVDQAPDGSTVVAMTAELQGIALQFKASGPASVFSAAAVNGGSISPQTAAAATGATAANATGATAATTNATNQVATTSQNAKTKAANRRQAAGGINILLHGDGGQSFFTFPNSGVKNNLMGVVALAPNDQMFWGGGAGLQRTDGALHATLVNSLITEVLPQMMTFDPNQVFFSGVSGGSLMMSGFFLPMFMDQFSTAANPTGAMLMCGGLAPQVTPSAGFGASLAATPVHFQSSLQELDSLQTSIPGSITEYAKLASAAGADDATINTLLTADATPNGGHCAFDGQDFDSGIQVMANGFANVIQTGGTGEVTGKDGLANVKVGVIGNDQTFGSNIPLAVASRNTVTQVPI